jgi:chorismate dehydratase
VELAKLLIRDYWKIDPQLINADEDFQQHIHGNTAGLVIGDRFIRAKESF